MFIQTLNKWTFTMLVCKRIWWGPDGERFFESSVETLSLHQSFTPTLCTLPRESESLEWRLDYSRCAIHSLIHWHSIIHFFKMRRVCVCVCVCVSGMPWSEFSTVTKTFFLCISFEIVKDTDYQHTAWEEPGWEKCRVLKRQSGAHPVQKKWHHSFIKETLRQHTLGMHQMSELKGEGRVLPVLWGPAWEPRGWRDLPVQGATGGHAACEATDPSLLEVRNAEDVGSDDSHRVWRVHEEPVLAQNHVPVLWEGGCKGRSFNQSAEETKLSYMEVL